MKIEHDCMTHQWVITSPYGSSMRFNTRQQAEDYIAWIHKRHPGSVPNHKFQSDPDECDISL